MPDMSVTSGSFTDCNVLSTKNVVSENTVPESSDLYIFNIHGIIVATMIQLYVYVHG
jgi:hypothetical protein